MDPRKPKASPRSPSGRRRPVSLRKRAFSKGDDCFRLADPQTGVASGWTRGRHMRSRCRCSMCSAIHINSRSWLRSSSTHEPSDPPLKVVRQVLHLPTSPHYPAGEVWPLSNSKQHVLRSVKGKNESGRAAGRHNRELADLFKPRSLRMREELPHQRH